MSTPFDDARLGAPACAECHAPLAADQRYCLECGTRVGALPEGVAAVIAAAAARAPQGAAAAPLEADDGDGDGADWLPSFTAVAPRTAAIAVMALLAFGVVVGSLVSPAAQSEASAPMIVAVAPAPVAAAAAAPAAEPTLPDTDADSAATPTDDGAAVDDTAADDTTSDDTGNDDSTDAGDDDTAPDASALPAVKHVFLIVLAGHGADEAFGAESPAPYLAKTLRDQGELINNYYGVTQGALANEIALISGQGPTPQTALNCPQYGDVAPGTVSDTDDQVQGDGCVYPAATKTLADQLIAADKTWKAYVEDIGSGPAGAATTCRHPALGTADGEQAPRPGDAYVTWRNPFVYFHSIVDDSTCATSDVGLPQLSFDLTSADTTPTVSYIVPNRCHDGGDEPCAPGQPAGLAAADDFLKTTVEQIQRSPAYKDGGLIAITFDQAPGTGDGADTSSCCTSAPFPNLPSTTAPASTLTPSATLPGSIATPSATVPPAATDAASAATPSTGTPTTATPDAASTTTPAAGVLPDDGALPGGGRTGLLLVSPFVEPGSTNLTDSYNHFSLLRSIEDLFDLDHLGYAADPALPSFDKAVYNAKAKK